MLSFSDNHQLGLCGMEQPQLPEQVVLVIDLESQSSDPARGFPVIDYLCPPGTGLDFIGIQVLVRMFGPGARHRWPTDRGIRRDDVVGPLLAAISDAIWFTEANCESPEKLQKLHCASGIPNGWPSPETSAQLRQLLIGWFFTFYPEAMRSPNTTLRHRAFAVSVDWIRQLGFLPTIELDKVAESVIEYAKKQHPVFWADEDYRVLLTKEAARYEIESRPKELGAWKMPPDSGEIVPNLPTIEHRLRRRADPEDDASKRKRKDADHDAADEAVQDQIDRRTAGEIIADQELRDYIDAIRAEGPAMAAAVDCSEGMSYSEASRIHDVTVSVIRTAEGKLEARLRRFRPDDPGTGTRSTT